MNVMSLAKELIEIAIATRNSDMMKELLQIQFPHENYQNYLITEYDGDLPRLFGDRRSIELMLPLYMDVVTENAVVDAIASGTLFDDKREIENKVDYISMTHFPHLGMMHKQMDEPCETKHAIGAVIGAMHQDGHFGKEDADLKNGTNYTMDLTRNGCENDTSVMDLTSDYLAIKDKFGKGCPPQLRRSLGKVTDELEDIKKVKAEDTVDADDYEEIGLDYETDDEDSDEIDHESESSNFRGWPNECDPPQRDSVDYAKEGTSAYEPTVVHGRGAGTTSMGTQATSAATSSTSSYQSNSNTASIKTEQHYMYTEEELYQESSAMLIKPKKLKPIPRDVVSYIISQKNAIRDTNDQAMISGYTCSKLELVDFYLNCLDVHDYRYIVPHNRQYLVQMQNDLNRCLQDILRVKPVNRLDRVWRVNVTYPEGFGG